MESSNFESFLNAKEKVIQRLNKQNEAANKACKELREEIATLKQLSDQNRKLMDAYKIQNESLQNKLFESQNQKQTLKNLTAAQSKKLEDFTLKFTVQTRLNTDLVEKIKALSSQLQLTRHQTLILESELQMEKTEILTFQQIKSENALLKQYWKAALNQISQQREENISLRRKQSEERKIIQTVLIGLKRFEEDQQNRQQQRQTPNQATSDLKDGRIQQLQFDLQKSLNKIKSKDQMIAVLNRQLQQRALIPKVLGEPDSTVSVNNAVHFIYEELKKRSAQMNRIVQKYQELLVYQQKTQKLIKQYQQKSQLNKNVLSQYKDLKSRFIQFQQKYNRSQETRKATDAQLILLLWENQALHKIAHKYLGPNFMEQVLKVQRELKNKRKQYKSIQKKEFCFSTVSELIDKNRELISIVKKLRAKQDKKTYMVIH